MPSPRYEELMKLAERVEREPASMALSREVAKIAGWHRVEPRHMHRANRHGAWISPTEWGGRDSQGKPVLDSLHGTEMHREPPDFVRSMDAAKSLIPPGYSYEVRKSGFDHFARATVWNPKRSPQAFDPGNGWTGETKGNDAAALTAASLRSLAQEADRG